jgi:hypothetical protein
VQTTLAESRPALLIFDWTRGEHMKTPTVVALALFTSLLSGSAARADVVTDWNVAALNAIRAGKTSPPIASRSLAILHIAIYDAVNGITRTHEPYLVESTVPRSASAEAAASAAAHSVLVALFPANNATFDTLYGTTLAAISDGPQKRAGIAWGASVAAEILSSRSVDGSDALIAPPQSGDLGAWESTPPSYAGFLLPQWAFLAPFAMPAGSFFRPPGPPALDSQTYAGDYNEVKALGSATGSSRTPEQELIALFWADGAGTETPPGHWNTIARDVSARAGNTLDENARLFALLNVAMADAAITAWDAKYFFNNWRPVTAIGNGDQDGNAATAGDPAWTPLLVTPPFPDYVSGHSTFSGAAAAVLSLFYGTDDIAFSTGSDFLPGRTRDFTSFSAAAAEAAVSRIYSGIHFRFASEDGLRVGTEIGTWTFTHYLAPKGNRSRR